jgi:hypothetical protein
MLLEKLFKKTSSAISSSYNVKVVCSFFVRDALLSEYSGNEFDNSIKKYNIKYVNLKTFGFIYNERAKFI